MVQLCAREIHPYNQVVAFVWEADAVSPHVELLEHLNAQADERSEFHADQVVLDEHPDVGDDEELHLIHVVHRFVPTWVRGNLNHQLTDTEHDLVILFRTGSYLFVHASCESVSNALIDFLNGRFEMVNQQKLVSLAALPQITFRAMGINNLFTPGGVAPESKAYYSRNAQQVLTTAHDGGFGFSYGMGSIDQDGVGRPKPIGVSPRKGKIWQGWSNDPAGFVTECSVLRELLDNVDPASGFDVLANPTSDDFANAVPVCFHMDYYDHKAGLVLMSRDRRQFTPEWVCYLTDETSQDGDKVVAVRIGEEGQPLVKLGLRREVDASWGLRYLTPGDTAFVVLAEDEEDVRGRHRRDLVEYLVEKQNFTILLDQGVAYRQSVYYRDNRFIPKFTRSEGDVVDWTGVDIRREEKPPRVNQPNHYTKNIAQVIKERLADYLFGVHVNGSGEVADFVVIQEGPRRKFILVHAKFSGEDAPGLRVDDLHEVCSQAVKNLKYLVPAHLAPATGNWHAKQFTVPALDQATCDAFVQSLLRELPSLDREVWIVQPGISKAALEADGANKIHSLLNYVDACCRINNAGFRFICSP